MREKPKTPGRLWLFLCATILLLVSLSARAQTTPNVKIDILGTGTESLLGGDLTDPENDGEDALEAATSPTWNWKSITASHEPDFEGGENSFNIFDNKVGGGNDKWCCDDPTIDAPVWVAVEFPQPVSLTHFTVTSGNDSPDRDPTDWAIQGSNDGEVYTDIYHFTDLTVPWTERNQVAKFTLPSASQPYRFIRYIAWETPGSLHQINEIEYFGIVGGGGLPDADKDGMPDDYEVAKGFNPNDASDAAKDFDSDGVSNLDEYKAGSDPIDTTKPTLLSTTTSDTFDTVKLTFSEELDPATATNTANYAISPTLAVTGASYKSKVVTLTTAKQAAGGTNYTVTVTGVRDLSKNEVAAGTSGSFFSYLLTKTGVLKFSYWGGIETTLIDNLTSDPRYPATPDLVKAVFSLNSRDAFPDDSHENYGAVMEGLITPTETASYDFFLRSDDASQLWLSTDDKEANLGLVAEETGCCGAFMEPGDPRTSTAPIALTAGKPYAIRVLYKEGGGGDYAQVAWRKTTDTTPAASLQPIPGKFLSAATELPAPAEGRLITQTPAPNAKGVKPNATVVVVHADGMTPWTSENVTLKLDGNTVSPTFTKDAGIATLRFPLPAGLQSKSTHTLSLGYVDPAGKPATLDWSFETYEYTGTSKDSVKGYTGYVVGNAAFTADAGGHSGKPGDYAIDSAKSGGWIHIPDASFLNAATKNDTLSVALWVKKYDIAAGSAFWVIGTDQDRAFQAHTPWSDDTIYFDTGGGCCDGLTQRVSDSITSFGDYTDDNTFWKAWHHFAFTKKADVKNVYIDGKLFINGSNSNPISTNITEMSLYTDGVPGANFMHATVDDLAIFSSELTAEDVAKLVAGTAPSALTGENLIAYWGFNDPTATGGSISLKVAKGTGGNLTLTWTGSGTLQSADSLGGTWTDMTGTASPATVPITGTTKFFRVKQ